MSSTSQSDPLLPVTDSSSPSDTSSSSKSSSTSTDTTTPPKSDTSNTSSNSNKSNGNTAGSSSTSPPGAIDASTLSPSGGTGTAGTSGTTGTTGSTTGTTGTTGASTGGTSGTSNTGNTGSTGSNTGGRTSTTNGNVLSPLPEISSSSSTVAPTRTSTTAVPSTTIPTSTSTSSIPTSTTAASSSTSASATHTSTTLGMITSTVIPNPTVVYSTSTPSATLVPTISPSAAPSEGSSTTLIGPIIGGIAGGLVGIILLTWLILIPIRRRAEQRKEVDWMPFGSDNDHLNDSGNDSLYRTPRSGVAEVETKAMESPDMYQMSDIGSNVNHNENMGSLYSHLDRNPSNPSRSTHPGATEGYMVANDVVGDMPAAHYPPGQPPVYYSHALAAQQQQQMYANYGAYSPNTSPEMAARRFVGQENGWVQSPAGIPNPHAGVAPVLRSQKSFNHPQGHSANGHDVHGLNRNPSAGSAPAYVSPQHTHAMPAPLPHSMHKQGMPPKGSSSPDHDEDCQLAYAQDAIGTPRPEHGQLSNLHVVNDASR